MSRKGGPQFNTVWTRLPHFLKKEKVSQLSSETSYGHYKSEYSQLIFPENQKIALFGFSGMVEGEGPGIANIWMSIVCKAFYKRHPLDSSQQLYKANPFPLFNRRDCRRLTVLINQPKVVQSTTGRETIWTQYVCPKGYALRFIIIPFVSLLLYISVLKLPNYFSPYHK